SAFESGPGMGSQTTGWPAGRSSPFLSRQFCRRDEGASPDQHHRLRAVGKVSRDGMSLDELKAWRKAERTRLLAARTSIDATTLEAWRQRIDSHLARAFPGLAGAKLAFYWP